VVASTGAPSHAGWAKTEDPATGRTYYFHVETKQTSWTWPPKL